MATSSLKKSFSLTGKTEISNFARMLEESVKNPPKIEKTGVKMSSTEDIKKILSILRRQNGNNASK